MNLTCLLLALISIIPAPRDAELDEDDRFQVFPGLPVVLPDDTQPEDYGVGALFEAIGYDLPVQPASAFDAGDTALYIGEAARHAAFEKRKLRKYAEDAGEHGPEGYRLTIWKKGAVVAGASRAGVWYGVQTLAQLARANPLSWPYLELRDWPERPVRGAVVRGLLTTGQVRAFAAIKCNWLLFESDDFYRLEGVTAQAWERVFEDARRMHIEPVPTVRMFSGAGPLLEMRPETAEGRLRTEPATLRGDDPAALSKTNVIRTETCPIEVRVSGILCRQRQDYLIDEGELEAPFYAINRPWMLRRMPGGRIPDGATVAVTYCYVPHGSSALNPYAPETEELLHQVFANLVATCTPNYVCIGGGEAARLNRDLRSVNQNKDNAEAFFELVHLAAGVLGDIDPAATVLLSNRLLDPWEDAYHLPPNAQLLAHARTDPVLPGQPLWTQTPGKPAMAVTLNASPARAYRAAAQILTGENGPRGLLVGAGSAESESLLVAAEKLWSPRYPLAAWPEGLNAHFGVDLWKPVHEARLAALTNHLNAHVLRGAEPDSLWEAFDPVREELEEILPEDDPELAMTAALLQNLLAYLELEHDYTEERGEKPLRELVEVVRRQAELDPSLAGERLERITGTIEEQGLFVPASILFGERLAYYRPYSVPGGRRLFEVPAEPEYTDTPFEASALLDFQAAPGQVARIAFETVRAKRVVLEKNTGDGAFRAIQEWTSDEAGGVRGPLFPEPPPRAAQLRLTLESAAEQAVLREMRVFALKSAPEAACSYTTEMRSGGAMPEAAWAGAPEAAGFLNLAARRFATAPSAVRLCRNRSHLFIGITAYEPRMHAMVADMTERDAPLWQQESVEVRIQAEENPLLRFVVSPQGTRHDAEAVLLGTRVAGWDAGWDGDWEAIAQRNDGAWAVVLAIPFSTLGERARAGGRWRANFLRHRLNIEEEHSAWAHDYEPPGRAHFGTIAFN